MHEKPQSASTIRFNQGEQGRAFLVKLPGAVGLEAKQLANSEGGSFAPKIFGRNPVARQVFFGKVDAAEFEVFMDITNDVGELEGEAEFFGKIEGAGVTKTEHVRAGQTYCSGHAITVFAETVEGRITANGEVPFGAADESVEIARGHVVTPHRVNQCGQDMPSARQSGGGRSHGGISVEDLLLSRDGLVESCAPAGETTLLGGQVLAFVGNIIDETHEGIKSSEGIALGLRQEEKCVIEVAIRGARDVMTLVVGFGNRCRQVWRSMRRSCYRRHG